MRSSMLTDQLAGRPLELDAIAGPILRALGSSGAPTTPAAVREILTLRDARAPRHAAAAPMPERPTPPAGEVAGRRRGLLRATTVADSNRAIGAP